MTTVLENPPRIVPVVGKAAVYTRVSTSKQEDGASLYVQLEACRRYCDDHSLLIMGEFQDIQSGLDSSRSQYTEAVELAKSKGIDKLVVWRLDRLGRDSAEYIPLLKGLKRMGVDVVSVTQPTESIFMQQVIGVMAEEESRQLSVRITASKFRRAKEGKWGNMAPFGYRNEKHPSGGATLVPGEEAPLVTEIFQKYATGRFSLGDIRKLLNEHGYVKSRYSILYLLTNPVYTGQLRYGLHARSQFHPQGEIVEVEGQHQPLIDLETFNRVQGKLAANRSRQRGGPAPKYLFSGLIFCSGCGYRYVGRVSGGRKGRKHVRYACNRNTNFGDCQSHSKYETRIREAVIPKIEGLIGQLKQEDVKTKVRERLAQQHKSASVDAGNRSLVDRREKLEARLTRLEDSYLDGDIGKDRYLTRRDGILAQLSEIKESLAIQPKVVDVDLDLLFALADAVDIVDGAITIAGEAVSDQWWRDVIEGLVDRITITGHAIEVQWKDAYGPMLTES